MTSDYNTINHMMNEKSLEGEKLKDITFNKLCEHLAKLDDWMFDRSSSERYELQHNRYDFKLYILPGMFSSRSWVEVRSTSDRIYFDKHQSAALLYKAKLIKKKVEVDSIQFVSDVVTGVYVLQHRATDKKHQEWLKENSTNKNAYKIVSGTVYIRDPELATAFKLMWF